MDRKHRTTIEVLSDTCKSCIMSVKGKCINLASPLYGEMKSPDKRWCSEHRRIK